MSYKKYNGVDKYHFRMYKRNGHHPFIVVMVSIKKNNNSYLLSGYMITHDIKKAIEYPKKYKRLKANPNKNDLKPTFVCVVRINDVDQSLFSKPYNNWHLSKEDEELIDELEKNAS